MGTQLALNDGDLDALAASIPHATSAELDEIERLLGISTAADDSATPPMSLYEFVQQAWSHVEPSVPFIRAWHLEWICEHLEAISTGRLDSDLLINIPFGCCKSLSVGLFWPCWEWTFRPATRWLFASYNRSRSIELSKTRRDLLKSQWYQSQWGHRVQLDREASSKSRFRNTRKGQMFATGIGGALGEHPDRIVVDDPSDADSIHSAVQREQVTSWWDNAIIGRGVLRGARKVVIMQRLHEQDLSGHILKQGGFTHICLPWEFEPGRMVSTPLGAIDRRTRPGELLWEAARHAIERVRRTMSPHVQAGQLQQRPSSPEGEFFKRTWFGDRFIERTEVPRGPIKDDRAPTAAVLAGTGTAVAASRGTTPPACSYWSATSSGTSWTWSVANGSSTNATRSSWRPQNATPCSARIM